LPVLGGVDVVAYWSIGANATKPVMGSVNFSYAWNGYTWWFKTCENLKKFALKESQYAPSYGGYCAYSYAEFGDLICVQPNVWYIAQSRLFLLRNPAVSYQWLPAIEDNIETADDKWVKEFKSLTFGPLNNGSYCPAVDPSRFFGVANWIVSLVILGIVSVTVIVGVTWMRIRSRRVLYENIY
jgi:hypothetical protein